VFAGASFVTSPVQISFIIYLSEPEVGWTAEDGGALEVVAYRSASNVCNRRFLQLYAADTSRAGMPATMPSARLLPLFNTFAMFAVEPNVSFHSVQEVVARDKWRISIQVRDGDRTRIDLICVRRDGFMTTQHLNRSHNDR
jgi:Rps23 Pro-64 3,4-dihydroxylase Tpa1-like proline 4-hydroxylase